MSLSVQFFRYVCASRLLSRAKPVIYAWKSTKFQIKYFSNYCKIQIVFLVRKIYISIFFRSYICVFGHWFTGPITLFIQHSYKRSLVYRICEIEIPDVLWCIFQLMKCLNLPDSFTKIMFPNFFLYELRKT